MSISEEAGRVGHDLADVEVVTSIDTVDKNASLEGSSEAASGDTALIRSSRVREGEARRSRTTLGRLMDVC